MRIVLNTLESQYHRCYRYGGIGATLSHGHPSTAQHQIHGVSSTATMRMRDQSQGSLEVDTPSIDPIDLKGLRFKKKIGAFKNERQNIYDLCRESKRHWARRGGSSRHSRPGLGLLYNSTSDSVTGCNGKS